MKKLILHIVPILFSLIVTSCNTDYYGRTSFQPATMNLIPPPGPELYRRGWADGCESGANSYSSGFYKQIKAFEYRYDAHYRNKPLYTQVWKDAFLYCSIRWERNNSLGGSI